MVIILIFKRARVQSFLSTLHFIHHIMKLLTVHAAVMLLALGTASVSADDSSAPSTTLLRHRHSFFSTLPEEPSDENLKVSRHQVQILGLNGFREWEVRGSLDSIWKASGKVGE